jgi:hypothetical protein
MLRRSSLLALLSLNLPCSGRRLFRQSASLCHAFQRRFIRFCRRCRLHRRHVASQFWRCRLWLVGLDHALVAGAYLTVHHTLLTICSGAKHATCHLSPRSRVVSPSASPLWPQIADLRCAQRVECQDSRGSEDHAWRPLHAPARHRLRHNGLQSLRPSERARIRLCQQVLG